MIAAARARVVPEVRPCRIDRVLGFHPRALIAACAVGAVALAACKHSNGYVSVGKGHDAGAGSSGTGAKGRAGKSGSKAGDAGAASQRDGAVKSDGGRTLADGAIASGAIDAGLLDGGLELPPGTQLLTDGGFELPDGEVIDLDAAVMRYGPEIPPTSCDISETDMWSTKVAAFDEGGYALVPGQTGFGLAYGGIGSSSCAQEIDLSHIPATHGFPDPHSALPDCHQIRDLNLLGTDDGWRLLWVDNATGMAELSTVMLDLDMNLPAGEARRRLTSNQLELEQKPTLAAVGTRPLAAWITHDAAGKDRITTQMLDMDSPPIEVVKAEDGHQPRQLALAEMGMGAAAIGWVGPAENPGVWLLQLDANGAAVGAPIQLTDRVAVSSSIGLGNRVNGGAAIYSIEIDGLPQVRFRRLDLNGAPLAIERSIVGPPLQAQGASIAPLGGGYAVAYRALPGGDVAQSEVRLTFVTKEGNVVRDPGGHLISFAIGDATPAESRTYIAVSVEGEIMVAWIDQDASGANLLKVVRRRLDCH